MTQTHFKSSTLIKVALYQPDIPQNTGNILRLAACFNVPVDIIGPAGFIIDDKRLKQVAMDYLDKSKIITYKSYENFLINKKNSRIILMTTKAKKNYHNFIFKPKDTILFGRESEGVPRIVHKNSYQRLKIPLKKNARSLNISMAVAITLSEALRQNSNL